VSTWQADPMTLPELDIARVRRWCVARVPEHARHQVRVECEVTPSHLTIVERRTPWRENDGPQWSTQPIARLRFTAADTTWTLFSRDRNLRFHTYDLIKPSPTSTISSQRSTAIPPTSSGVDAAPNSSGPGLHRRQRSPDS
jgi:hypothetical protein